MTPPYDEFRDSLTAEIIDETTGEVLPDDPPETALTIYKGISELAFPAETAAILTAPITDEDIELRPDGLLYMPEIKYRRVLNKAFGPGGWAIRRVDEIRVDREEGMVYWPGALFAYGRFVAEAIGEQQYFANNKGMSWGGAVESAKSNCLVRCCKDLGIASELWEPKFTKAWLSAHAVEVWCVGTGENNRGKKKKLWRLRNAPALDAFPWKEESATSKNKSAAADDYRMPDGDNMENYYPQPPFDQGGNLPSDDRRTVEPETKYNADQKQVHISAKQIERFKQIAYRNEWDNREAKYLIELFGFAKLAEVTRNKYDELCAKLEMPEMLEDVRGQLQTAKDEARP